MAAQLPDIIILHGEEMNLFSNPLEEYWITLRKRRPSFCPSSVCKRGYVATWEIKDNHLYLTEITGSFESWSFLTGKTIMQCSLNALLKSRNGTIKADWYSGKLRIPNGRMTAYEHNDYDSRFEKEIIITVDHGDVIKMVTLDYTRRVLISN